MKTTGILICFSLLVLLASSCDRENVYSITEEGFAPEPEIMEIERGAFRYVFKEDVTLETSGYAYRSSQVSNDTTRYMYTIAPVPCTCKDGSLGISCSGAVDFNGINLHVFFFANEFTTTNSFAPIVNAYQEGEDGAIEFLKSGPEFNLYCGENGPYLDPIITIEEINDEYIKGRLEGDFFRQVEYNIGFPPFPCDAYEYEGKMTIEFNLPISYCD